MILWRADDGDTLLKLYVSEREYDEAIDNLDAKSKKIIIASPVDDWVFDRELDYPHVRHQELD